MRRKQPKPTAEDLEAEQEAREDIREPRTFLRLPPGCAMMLMGQWKPVPVIGAYLWQ